ncbi:MAG TPA: type 1 glutamine amidotransferase domain-containing protein [Acidisarcina sp.]
MAVLRGKKIAFLVADGFEEIELTKPKEALEKAGAKTVVVSLKPGKIQGMNHDHKGDKIKVDKTVDEVSAADFDNLVLPGGVQNPDYLRVNEQAVAFVKDFFDAGKAVAAICHGPWTLIEAGVVKGRTMTSWPSLKTDLTNAGAKWVDEEVVSDNGLITSRNPSDIPAFNEQIIAEFSGESKLRQAS